MPTSSIIKKMSITYKTLTNLNLKNSNFYFYFVPLTLIVIKIVHDISEDKLMHKYILKCYSVFFSNASYKVEYNNEEKSGNKIYFK